MWVRWPLSVALLIPIAGCVSQYAVPDAATAIAIGKKQCTSDHGAKALDAELVGNTWTVHWRGLSMNFFSEMTMQVTREGVITPECKMIPKPGLHLVQ